jgi:DnaK suppressor protein
MPTNKRNCINKTKVKFSTKDQILKQLKELESQEAPPTKMGAMCYSMSAPPEVAEYVCPVCGEKTYYSRDHAVFVAWEIDACRREFQNLQKHTDICSLDESSFCASCCPEATDYKLKLTITYPDSSSVVSPSVNSDQIRILCGFFQGKLSYSTSTDGSIPLKSELRTLRNLLIYGSSPSQHEPAEYSQHELPEYPQFEPAEYSRKKQGDRVPAELAIKLNSKEYKIRTVLESMKKEIFQDIHLHTDAANATAATKEPDADIYDLAAADRDRELYLLLSDFDREKLRDIDEALHRIDTGEYGACEECGEDIPFEWLKVLPFTRHCIRCKSNLEKLQNNSSDE